MVDVELLMSAPAAGQTFGLRGMAQFLHGPDAYQGPQGEEGEGVAPANGSYEWRDEANGEEGQQETETGLQGQGGANVFWLA